MTREVKVLTPDMPMREVVDLFRQVRISGAPVIDRQTLVGIISMEDLIRCLCASDLDSPASKYMTPDPFVVSSSDPVIEALKVFVNSNVGRLPVVDQNGELAGILTKGDITRGLLRALQRNYEVEEVRTYRASHLFEDIESDRSSLILRYNIKPRDFPGRWLGLIQYQASAAAPRFEPTDCPAHRHRCLRSRDEPDHSHHQRRCLAGGN
jgi:CBS domain-containing protein